MIKHDKTMLKVGNRHWHTRIDSKTDAFHPNEKSNQFCSTRPVFLSWLWTWILRLFEQSEQSSSAWHTKFHGISNIQTWMWSTLHSYGFYDKFYFMPINPFIRGSWLFRAALLADLRGVAWRAALEVAPFSVVFPAPLLRGVFALATLALETAPWRTFTTDKTEGASLFPETACLLFSTHIRNAFETRSANTSASPRLISKACIAPSLSGCSLTRLVFSATSHKKSR